MKDYIYENYKNPLCWKYSFNYVHKYMYGEFSDKKVNIIILYKNADDKNCIDTGNIMNIATAMVIVFVHSVYIWIYMIL